MDGSEFLSAHARKDDYPTSPTYCALCTGESWAQDDHLNDRAHDGGDDNPQSPCPACGAVNHPLGWLASRVHYRCRQCSQMWSHGRGEQDGPRGDCY